MIFKENFDSLSFVILENVDIKGNEEILITFILYIYFLYSILIFL